MNYTRANGKFTAIVVGKRLCTVVLTVCIIIALVFIMIFVFSTICRADTDIHKKSIQSAYPAVYASDSIGSVEQIKNLFCSWLGVDAKNKVTNFDIMPYFATACNSSNIVAEATVADSADNNNAIDIKQAEDAPVYSSDIKNSTSYIVDTAQLPADAGVFELDDGGPQILIVHTHGTECYMSSDNNTARCNDTEYNVVRVGTELAKELEIRGLKVVHDKSLNDYPSYNNSYNKTLTVIDKYLSEYPSIKCVLDVHRDAVEKDGNRVKFTTEIDGGDVAQVMIVCGSEGLGLPHPDWKYNLGFALRIQSYLNSTYPGLMRSVSLRNERFNMHRTRGSLILEFGTHGNTIDEALASVKYVAEGIAQTLK